MIVATTDPITFRKIADTDRAPFVIEGEGPHALKIYFESEQSRQQYIRTPLYAQHAGVLDCYTQSATL